MKKDTHISNRKSDHIRINLEEDVQSALTNGLADFRLIHQALPEMALTDVDLRQQMFWKTQRVPILVSSMTGGTKAAARINRILATAAQENGLAMGVGSQRAALKAPSTANTFKVRDYAPDILLFANLGAVQLNYGYGLDECQRAVEMIDANALILHLNPLQEALQPEGDANFKDLIHQISDLKRVLSVPLIVKEVGWGISSKAAKMLVEAGVDAIDVAGAGGTSWSQVEMHRIEDPFKTKTASVFNGWGISTAESIQNVRRVDPDITVFASGGLKNGIDIVKCLALGANMGGMAGLFLKAAADSLETAVRTMGMIVNQVRIAMFAAGVKNIKDLNPKHLKKIQRPSSNE
jgi:isopentenyl-diphosphate Delta-isomerase